MIMENRKVLYGWNPNLDIPAAVSVGGAQWVADTEVLISTVDSSSRVTELTSLKPLLDRLGATHSDLDAGVVIDGETLLTLICGQDFFDGFDELWFFNAMPSEAKPEAVPLTSDVQLTHPPADVLVQWMLDSNCIAGLGDGVGLNFVTFDESLARLWS
jgi:hypothetical protein